MEEGGRGKARGIGRGREEREGYPGRVGRNERK